MSTEGDPRRRLTVLLMTAIAARNLVREAGDSCARCGEKAQRPQHWFYEGPEPSPPGAEIHAYQSYADRIAELEDGLVCLSLSYLQAQEAVSHDD